MGLLRLYIMRRKSVIKVSLYLLTLLFQSRVRLPFIALLKFSRLRSFKRSKSELNTKNKLLKLKRSFSGNSKRKRRGLW